MALVMKESTNSGTKATTPMDQVSIAGSLLRFLYVDLWLKGIKARGNSVPKTESEQGFH